jgi:hypothetical protein
VTGVGSEERAVDAFAHIRVTSESDVFHLPLVEKELDGL